MDRPGSRGVTVTMIVNWLASEQLDVPRSTVRSWLAEDIKRGIAERVTIGFYRLRRDGETDRQDHGPRSQ